MHVHAKKHIYMPTYTMYVCTYMYHLARILIINFFWKYFTFGEIVREMCTQGESDKITRYHCLLSQHGVLRTFDHRQSFCSGVGLRLLLTVIFLL